VSDLMNLYRAVKSLLTLSLMLLGTTTTTTSI